jgi:hypothetical protein
VVPLTRSEDYPESRGVFIVIAHRIVGDGDIGVGRGEGMGSVYSLSSYLCSLEKLASNGAL